MHRMTITIEATFDDDVPEDLGGPGWRFEVDGNPDVPWSLLDPIKEICRTLTGDRAAPLRREMDAWLAGKGERFKPPETMLLVVWIPSSRRWEWRLRLADPEENAVNGALRSGTLHLPRNRDVPRTRISRAARVACPEYPASGDIYVDTQRGDGELEVIR